MRSFASSLVFAFAVVGTPVLAADVPDPWITTKTKLEMWTTAGVPSSAVHVDTRDGVVTLYGKVESDAQKTGAEKAASGVEGVKSVKSLLQVVPASSAKRVARDDRDLRAAVEKSLAADTSLAGTKLAVKSVDKGVVLISGEARSMSELLRAVAHVYDVPGVRKVSSDAKAPQRFDDPDSRLDAKVDSQVADTKATLTDVGITTAVKMRLWTAENIPSVEINVDTTNADVTLFGIVPSDVVKTAAAQEASKVAGVKHVDNQLQVVASSEKKRVEAKDDAIEASLKADFGARPELKDVKYSVKAGLVRLTGNVPSTLEKLNALRIARFTDGVHSVGSQLNVVPAQRPTN